MFVHTVGFHITSRGNVDQINATILSLKGNNVSYQTLINQIRFNLAGDKLKSSTEKKPLAQKRYIH